MVGIVGVLGLDGARDQSELAKRMSLTIAHRGNERLFKHLSSDNGCGVIAVRSRLDCDHSIALSQNGVTILDQWTLKSPVEGRHDDMPYIVDGLGALSHPAGDSSSLDTMVVVLEKTGLLSSRSHLAMKPLYYQCRGPDFVFSTERKALWRLGIDTASELHPGQELRVVPGQKPSVLERARIAHPDTSTPSSRNEAIEALSSTLKESFRRLRGLRNVGVLFSGGVDSSLAAMMTQDVCKNIMLVAACAEGSHDDRLASGVADKLGMNLLKVRLVPESVWETLPELIYAVERSRKPDIEIALPFFVAAREAHNAGLSVLVSGQGPDELFGGYARYVRTFIQAGEKALDEQMWNDVMSTHRTNIERDERAIEYNQVSAFFPYLYSHFILTAMSIPSSWKVAPGAVPDRKLIFRELAQDMGLSPDIALMAKKAAQYSSGSGRIVAKAVCSKVDAKKDSRRTSRIMMVQAALDTIASEIGVPLSHPTRANLKIDLKPTMRFIERIRETSRP